MTVEGTVCQGLAVGHSLRDNAGHRVHCIESEIGARRVAGPPDHLEPRGGLPLVRAHGLHPARLADNHAERPLA